MNNKITFIAGAIGLVFGVLIAGTIGLNFFPEEETNDNQSVMPALNLDEEGFKDAYSLDTSIYIPILGSDVYTRMNNDETFILYIGRSTCPYCQQLVPDLQQAALDNGYTTIYHVDILDTNNQVFLYEQGISSVPFTAIIVDGVTVEAFLGYQSYESINTMLENLE